MKRFYAVALRAAGLLPVLLGLPVGAMVVTAPATASSTAGPPAGYRPSRAGWEVLRYDCANDVVRHDVTLFENGTLRLREGPPGRETMTLVSLDPDTLQAFLNRLEREKPPDWGDLHSRAPSGAQTEVCRLAVHLPDEAAKHEFRFGRNDSLPLALARLEAIAEDVSAAAEKQKRLSQGLPPGYDPKPGDVLRRRDGVLFRVVSYTGDKRGVELQGVDQPLTIYQVRDSLSLEFIELVSRRQR